MLELSPKEKEFYQKAFRITVPIAVSVLIGALLFYRYYKAEYIPQIQNQVQTCDPNESNLEEILH